MEHPLLKPLSRIWRRLFQAALLVILPLAVTWFVLRLMVNFSETLLGWLPDAWMVLEPFPGRGVVVLLLGLLLVGVLVLTPPVRRLIQAVEGLIRRIPLVQNIYFAVRQLLESLFALTTEKYQRVVLVEFPRKGMHAIGFVTGDGGGEVQARTGGRILSIFLPTTPNPTSGFLLFISEHEVIPLQMSVEDGIKLVISGGIVKPPWPNPFQDVEEQPASVEVSP